MSDRFVKYDADHDVTLVQNDRGEWVVTSGDPGPEQRVIQPYQQQVLEQPDADAVAAIQQPARAAMSTAHTVPSHAPTEHARASLLYSKAHIAALAFGVTSLIILAYFFGAFGDSLTIAIAFWLGGLSVSAMVTLHYNRRQGLHHSTTGVMHSEIESRERIAVHAIDAHVDLLKSKWGLSNER